MIVMKRAELQMNFLERDNLFEISGYFQEMKSESFEDRRNMKCMCV